MKPRSINELRRAISSGITASQQRRQDEDIQQAKDWMPGGRAGGSAIHTAYSKNAAAANTSAFAAYLDTDGTGEEITVTPKCNTTVTALSAALPRLYDGTPIAVYRNAAGNWETVITFEKTKAC